MAKTHRNSPNTKWYVYIGLIVIAVLSRLMPHPDNITAMGSVALLGSAFMSRKHLAILVPIAALLISDFVLNNTIYASYFDGVAWFSSGVIWMILGYSAMFLIGWYVFSRGKGPIHATMAVIVSSVAFFLLSNLGVWSVSGMYLKTFGGYLTCLTAGIPFFRVSLIGNLVYTAILFGLFAWLKHYKPAVLFRTSEA